MAALPPTLNPETRSGHSQPVRSCKTASFHPLNRWKIFARGVVSQALRFPDYKAAKDVQRQAPKVKIGLFTRNHHGAVGCHGWVFDRPGSKRNLLHALETPRIPIQVSFEQMRMAVDVQTADDAISG